MNKLKKLFLNYYTQTEDDIQFYFENLSNLKNFKSIVLVSSIIIYLFV